jgi:hypothetical protein
LDRKLDSWLNLKGHEAIGLWVEGDGNGQIIAVRLESPRHISYGAVADRYITVDFAGRRQFTLIETESARWSDYVWNDGKGFYNVYRETVNFGTVESMSIWYNNLPKGQDVRCVIGPVKALPMVSCKVRDPSVSVNGKSVLFPVDMPSGSYLEFNTAGDCMLHGSNGELITRVSPEGETPLLSAGQNQIQFSCGGADGPVPRVKLTVISHGQLL